MITNKDEGQGCFCMCLGTVLVPGFSGYSNGTDLVLRKGLSQCAGKCVQYVHAALLLRS